MIIKHQRTGHLNLRNRLHTKNKKQFPPFITKTRTQINDPKKFSKFKNSRKGKLPKLKMKLKKMNFKKLSKPKSKASLFQAKIAKIDKKNTQAKERKNQAQNETKIFMKDRKYKVKLNQINSSFLNKTQKQMNHAQFYSELNAFKLVSPELKRLALKTFSKFVTKTQKKNKSFKNFKLGQLMKENRF